MGVFMSVPRVSDPTPYQYPLWAEHDAPSGYSWTFLRAGSVDVDFSFKLHFHRLQRFAGAADVGLALSLRKWTVLAASVERLAGWLGPDQLVYVDEGGYDTCALCQAFMDGGRNCQGCPIRNYTQQELCNDTPYADLYQDTVQPVLAWQDIADREVEFLTMLRGERDTGHWEGTWPPTS